LLTFHRSLLPEYYHPILPGSFSFVVEENILFVVDLNQNELWLISFFNSSFATQYYITKCL
jgi:hypothetical protein